MTILITGIHGFVGSGFTEAFHDHYLIYGLDILTPDKTGVIKTFLWSDLNQNKLPEVDVIIHLAGKAHDTRNTSDAKSYFDINTGLTQKIFDKFITSDTGKFIFFSSVKAAADKVEGDFLTEDVVPSPVGPYGESKIKAEEYILDKIRKNPEKFTGKRVYILRPCMIHGPGNKGNLNLLYRIAKTGMPWPLGSFENKRSFTSFDNLAFIVDKLIASDVESGIYNFCDDSPLSTNELIKLMACSVGKKTRVLKINKRFIGYCAKLGDILHLPLNSLRLQKLTENYIVSNDKIKKALKIDSLPLTSEEGMIRTLNSFRND
ncbi:MAG: hypothetical protein ACD_77C00103G0006 [uncultured bacterium]|nr:MAG: hypothetical protein ACD_77C00103G0006 [uncultured bacterium]